MIQRSDCSHLNIIPHHILINPPPPSNFYPPQAPLFLYLNIKKCSITLKREGGGM